MCPPPQILISGAPYLLTQPPKPYAILTQMPWRGALAYKLACLRYRHLNAWISLARDRDSGRVYPDPLTGKPCIEYTVSPFDAAHVLEGLIALAKIAYVSGATEIDAFLPGVEPFVRSPPPSSPNSPNPHSPSSSSSSGEVSATEATYDLGVKDPRFEAWLSSLRSNGNSPPYPPYTSAHQMGTCRMSSKPENGVVDPRGRVWGTEGLYVADASVFPSASGVNPMITNMAIADWIARGVAGELSR